MRAGREFPRLDPLQAQLIHLNLHRYTRPPPQKPLSPTRFY